MHIEVRRRSLVADQPFQAAEQAVVFPGAECPFADMQHGSLEMHEPPIFVRLGFIDDLDPVIIGEHERETAVPPRARPVIKGASEFQTAPAGPEVRRFELVGIDESARQLRALLYDQVAELARHRHPRPTVGLVDIHREYAVAEVIRREDQAHMPVPEHEGPARAGEARPIKGSPLHGDCPGDDHLGGFGRRLEAGKDCAHLDFRGQRAFGQELPFQDRRFVPLDRRQPDRPLACQQTQTLPAVLIRPSLPGSGRPPVSATSQVTAKGFPSSSTGRGTFSASDNLGGNKSWISSSLKARS